MTQIGKLLGYLAFEKDTNQVCTWPDLTPEERTHLNQLRELKDAFMNSQMLPVSHSVIPQFECMSDKSFLSHNEEFFLSMILFKDQLPNLHESCQHFIKHLNDCYQCFDVFCQVIREYRQCLMALSRSEKAERIHG